MVPSATLLEREGRSTVLDYTISLGCTRHKGGTFSLTLTESSDIGDLHHPVAQRIRSPRTFIDSLMSLMGWTELEIDFDVILNEICTPLRDLDEKFADAIVEHIQADREGRPVRSGKLRA